MTRFPLTYENADGWIRRGSVTGVSASTIEVRAHGLTPGSVVRIHTRASEWALAEVRSVSGAEAQCAPVADVRAVAVGDRAASDRARLGAFVGEELLGNEVDAWGRSPDQGIGRVVSPGLRRGLIDRAPVERAMQTGVAAIDAFLTLGYGQRVALTAGTGVGKTTLLRTIVERADVDARVIALIGERTRDALETIERCKASNFWRTTTVVVAAADAPPIERIAAARTATAQAEWLCASGRRVLLAIDSLTRMATAWREVALAAGESAAYRGFPPSIVGALAELVERAGPWKRGSITGVYAILVDGDDPYEPITDAVRALLDGHIVLSRRLADAGRFPAIDVLRSLSRTMSAVVPEKQLRDSTLVRSAIAALEGAEDLIAVGAYRQGADPWLDACLAQQPAIERLIHDGERRRADPIAELAHIAERLRAAKGEYDERFTAE